MMYLRHEAGHAFNYAYRLYTTPEWRELFGPFRRPYRDALPAGAVLAPVRAPHRGLVRAEASRRGLRRDLRGVADAAARSWRKRYKGWPALAQAALRRPHGAPAPRQPTRCARTATPTSPSRTWRSRSSEFYQQADRASSGAAVDLALDTDLVDIFMASRPQAQGRPAGGRSAARAPQAADRQGDLLDRACSARSSARWSSRIEPHVRGARPAGRRSRARGEHLVELTAYATTLAMNYLTRGKFVQP